MISGMRTSIQSLPPSASCCGRALREWKQASMILAECGYDAPRFDSVVGFSDHWRYRPRTWYDVFHSVLSSLGFPFACFSAASLIRHAHFFALRSNIQAVLSTRARDTNRRAMYQRMSSSIKSRWMCDEHSACSAGILDQCRVGFR